MSYKREKDQQYRSKWHSILNFVKNNTGYSVAGVARAGSRRQGGSRPDSDLDIRFAISGDPSKQSIYPNLKEKLKTAFPNARVRIGSSYNVINMSINDLDFDIVLLSVGEFTRQVQNDKLERM
jgi:hypothetical protein